MAARRRRREALGGAGSHEASLVRSCSALGRPASPLRFPETLIPRIWGGAAPGIRNVTGTGERHTRTCGGSAPKILPPIFPRMLEPWGHPRHGDTWCCGPTAVTEGAKWQLRETTHSEPHTGSRAVGQPGRGTPQLPSPVLQGWLCLPEVASRNPKGSAWPWSIPGLTHPCPSLSSFSGMGFSGGTLTVGCRG